MLVLLIDILCGPFPIVDLSLQWTFCFRGHFSLVGLLLQWTFCFSGPFASVDLLLQWTFRFSGTFALVNLFTSVELSLLENNLIGRAIVWIVFGSNSTQVTVFKMVVSLNISKLITILMIKITYL